MSPFRTPILMYHHVETLPLDPPPRFGGNYVALEDFVAQLDSLGTRGVETLTLAEAVERHDAGANGKAVVLTFDDGCACFRDRVAPELAERGMTATLFAVAGGLGGSNAWDEASGERREEILGAEDLRSLADRGVEIGCHSRSHADLTRLGADGEDGDLEGETAGAKAQLEDALGRDVRTFCYPYGHFDAGSREAVAAAGFRAAVSAWGYPGVSETDRYALPRVGVEPGESALGFRLKSSGAYRVVRRLPRIGLMRAMRGTKRQ